MNSEIKLIGIAGNRYGCGKNEVANIIRDLTKVPTTGYPTMYTQNWQIHGFADKLKKVASVILNVPVDRFNDQEFKKSTLPIEWNKVIKNWSILDGKWISREINTPMTVRQFLQNLGVGMRQTVHNDIWVNALFSEYDNKESWIIPDTRFLNECEAIKSRGGVIIKVTREGLEGDTHVSENSLDDYNFDFLIKNDSTIEELKEQVRLMLENFKLL